jgi:predicted dehydrogenase
MRRLRIGVIGVGYIGNYHAQKYMQVSETELAFICDINEKALKKKAQLYECDYTLDYRSLLGKVDAVSITVPTVLHFEVAKFFLENGVAVLLEKPMTCTLDEADALIDTANKHSTVFQIGHLERFNNVLKSMEGVIDNPRFIDSSRLASFQLRGTDVNVALDLMIHDIDIIQHLVQSPIARIAANGAAVLSPYIDIANARIEFENGCVANVTASRISPRAERTMRVFQPNDFCVMNFKDKSLVIHRKGPQEMFPGIPEMLREGRSFAEGDALHDQAHAFAASVLHGSPVVVTAEEGRRALKTAIDITHIVRQSSDWRYSVLSKEGQEQPIEL